MIKQKPYQSRTFKKCLDIIEQLRYDRDKYIGMWRSQCNIAEEVMKERDRLTAELARYKQGVEVETIVHSNGSSWAGFDAYVHVQVPLAWSQQRVRVLVMKEEG